MIRSIQIQNPLVTIKTRTRLYSMSVFGIVVLILCHLFVGIMLGLALYLWFRKERLLFAIILGSILPDLLDKPLGHLVLDGSLDNGRIFFHGLLAVGIVALGALVTIRTQYGIVFGGLALGMISHQILDSIWLDTASWFFPLLGPYVPDHYPQFFINALWAEITSPTEWLFLLVSFSLIFPLAAQRIGWISRRWKRRLNGVSDFGLRWGPWLLVTAGLTIIMTAFVTTSQNLEDLTAMVMLGITSLSGAAFMAWWRGGERLGWNKNPIK